MHKKTSKTCQGVYILPVQSGMEDVYTTDRFCGPFSGNTSPDNPQETLCTLALHSESRNWIAFIDLKKWSPCIPIAEAKGFTAVTGK